MFIIKKPTELLKTQLSDSSVFNSSVVGFVMSMMMRKASQLIHSLGASEGVSSTNARSLDFLPFKMKPS